MMDYEKIKKQANEILKTQASENSYIEYKTSALQLDKILKTICAYGNNYYDNDMQYIFLGVAEVNDGQNKSIPQIPISGIEEGTIEKTKNALNSLRSLLYPNIAFDLISNEFEGRKYILLAVPRQTGGPFMVSEKAEREKKVRLKAGRYIRVEAESRLARIDEEYDLLRKFANYHFSSISTTDATIDDLSIDYIKEYLQRTSDRGITEKLSKIDMARSLNLLDKNDPSERRVKNHAVLMFSERPEMFIPYSFAELIVDIYGSKRKMESKRFHGPIWKQYHAITNYINENYLNTITLREDGKAENRKISNFPYVSVEELIANAIVHNNYENAKPIQLYVSKKEINIVNYNKPLPPLKISDLNERMIFNERDTENPEIRDMFKTLGIIESFGTGIGEAKRAAFENGSPEIYYKEFTANDNVTSVVIPVNEEYISIKEGLNPQKKLGIESETLSFKKRISESGYSKNTKSNLVLLFETIGTEVFGNTRVMEVLGCAESTATLYIKRLDEELKLISPVEGQGKGKYRFIS